MEQFFIENGILKAYLGHERIVVVPDGVKQIGGVLKDEHSSFPKYLRGDPIGYKAFYGNEEIEELYLPDSVETIGFKALEHCKNLKKLAFSNKMTNIECNGMLGCNNLKTILYRGTLYEFSCLHLEGGKEFDLDYVYCSDGVMTLHEEYYMDTLYFPGTREEWEQKYRTDDWRKKRAKKIVFLKE